MPESVCTIRHKFGRRVLEISEWRAVVLYCITKVALFRDTFTIRITSKNYQTYIEACACQVSGQASVKQGQYLGTSEAGVSARKRRAQRLWKARNALSHPPDPCSCWCGIASSEWLLPLPLPCWLEGRREKGGEGRSDAVHLIEEEGEEGRKGGRVVRRHREEGARRVGDDKEGRGERRRRMGESRDGPLWRGGGRGRRRRRRRMTRCVGLLPKPRR